MTLDAAIERLRRLPAAVDVLRGRRVAVTPPRPPESGGERWKCSELRHMIDLVGVYHELDPLWFQHATSARLDSIEACIGVERSYRQARWEYVEAGGWPQSTPWPR